MGDDPVPLEYLPITRHHGGATTTVDRLDAAGGCHPVWQLLDGSGGHGGKTIAVVYADPRYQQQPSFGFGGGGGIGPALGTARFHSMSSKIDVVLRGSEFVMRNDDPLGLSDRHAFSYLGTPPLAWRKSSMSSTMYYEDAQGRKLAAFKKRRSGLMGASNPCFELYVPATALDMDLLVVTGLAAVARAKKTASEEAEVVEAVFGA